MTTGVGGSFLNVDGYDLHRETVAPYLWVFRKTLFHFALDPAHPLTYRTADGDYVQPDRNFLTDWGSTPATMQLVVPKDRFIGYLFHDSAYCHKGLWFASHQDGPYTFHQLTRLAVDRLCLLDMIEADPCPPRCWEPGLIYGTVRTFGQVAWEKKRDEGKRPRRRAGVLKPPAPLEASGC